ncbi:HNH endonuclease family protein [Streptomyces sp. NPDC048171]|uniref:HNH endonuclease family protein n=1 Tax=Streptomyces sp. NPDC048171 TaxID=3365504 RepID=UPI003718E663
MKPARLLSALAAFVSAGALFVSAPAVQAADDQVLPLRQAVASLPVADEDRTGYDRDLFRHWVDADRDGCDTRREVLLEEAVTAPEVTGRCTLTAGTGTWYSWYDDTTVTGSRATDIDHLVPLAEAWDSGASTWTPKHREEYANDLGDPRALVAVTARSNRQKSDQDVAEWLPAENVVCRYIGEWTAVKLRHRLTADPTEHAVLTERATGCPNEPVRIIPTD